MEGEMAYTCCRSTVEVWRCGHTYEHPLQCQEYFPAGGPMSHTTTHRIRIDHAGPCATCQPGVVALQFRGEGPAPLVQAANQGPVRPPRNQQANTVNPYLNAQRRAAGAADQPVQGRETTEESVVETTESDEPDNEVEEELQAEGDVEPNSQRREGPISRREYFARKRDEKMTREFAEKPYRVRGARGGRGH